MANFWWRRYSFWFFPRWHLSLHSSQSRWSCQKTDSHHVSVKLLKLLRFVYLRSHWRDAFLGTLAVRNLTGFHRWFSGRIHAWRNQRGHVASQKWCNDMSWSNHLIRRYNSLGSGRPFRNRVPTLYVFFLQLASCISGTVKLETPEKFHGYIARSLWRSDNEPRCWVVQDIYVKLFKSSINHNLFVKWFHSWLKRMSLPHRKVHAALVQWSWRRKPKPIPKKKWNKHTYFCWFVFLKNKHKLF